MKYFCYFLHFCVVFLPYFKIKKYFCGKKTYTSMINIEELFVAANTIHDTPNYNSSELSTLIQTVDAFTRVTYHSIYLIDHYNRDFLYVSENSLSLCDHTNEDVKKTGYNFYLKCVPEEELKNLIELNHSGFKFLETFDDVDKYQCSMSYHIHLNCGTKKKLVNHQITPVLLTNEGKIWISMCVVSLPSYKTAGHAELHKNGLNKYWEYSFGEHQWKEYKEISLKEEELDVLQMSAAGFTMSEIADEECRSLDTIKFYKRHVFDKLHVTNNTEAVSRAASCKLF